MSFNDLSLEERHGFAIYCEENDIRDFENIKYMDAKHNYTNMSNEERKKYVEKNNKRDEQFIRNLYNKNRDIFQFLLENNKFN